MQWVDRIGRRLKLRDVHIFLAVVQRGSMAKAADDLAISQPVVSKAIADLEHTLGVRLLDRSRRGVEPTMYGRAVINHGIAAFDELKQAVEEVQFLADPNVGEVRIGSTEAMTAGLVPVVIDHLSRQFPGLVFNVIQAPTVTLQYRDLRERRVELILGRMVTPVADEDLNVEALFDDPLFVVAGANSKWLRRRRIDPNDLINEPWSLPPYDSFVGSRIVDIFRAIGLPPPRQTVISTSIQLFNALVVTGRFLAILSGSTLRFSGKRLGLKALPIDLPIQSGPVGIVTLKSRMLSPAAELFIARARKIAMPLAKER